MTRASDLARLLGAGATILDGTTISTADNTDSLILTSTDADASSGPNLNMFRNSSSPADNDFLGNVKFNGRNDNSQDVQYSEIEVYATDVSDGTEDGLYNVNVMTGGSNLSYMQLKAGSGAVFNEDSNDIDFRVESNGEANMFFVDGGNDRVVISKSSSGATTFPLVLSNPPDNSASTAVGLRFVPTNATIGDRTCDIVASQTTSGGNAMFMEFRVSNGGTSVTHMKIHNSGTVSFNNGITLGNGISAASSNLLDDYEEGTWTPTFTDGSNTGTLSSPSGFYTKIGDTVIADYSYSINSLSGVSGGSTAQVGGLPFTAKNDFTGAQGSVRSQGIGGANNLPVVSEVLQNTTNLRYHFFSGDSTQLVVTVNQFSASDFVAGQMIYRV